MQFLPMLLVPVVSSFKLLARSAHALLDRDWRAALGLYAAAQLMELADRTVLDGPGFTGGHLLKHLPVAAATLLRAASPISSGSRR